MKKIIFFYHQKYFNLEKIIKWQKTYHFLIVNILLLVKVIKLINLNSIQDFYKNKTPHTIDKNLGWVLNLGNFIVHKKLI